MKGGVAGRLADAFLASKITPLLLGAALALGIYTSATLPCPGAEHLLLAFPKRFLPSRQKVASHRTPSTFGA